jgi:hypothetical protein
VLHRGKIICAPESVSMGATAAAYAVFSEQGCFVHFDVGER